jgi:predicted nucleic acid-binding protein
MASKYVLDAYAWIEYLIGSRAGETVKSLLDGERTEVYTCAVTLAEVVSKTAREGGDAELAYDILLSNSEVVNADAALSKDAGVLHAALRKTIPDFGLADAYVLALARRTKAKVLTGDPHFRGIRDATLLPP